MSRDRRQAGIEKNHPLLSVWRQCRLLSLTRSTLYATPAGESTENLALMRWIDEQFLETPW
jgi:putative transposase